MSTVDELSRKEDCRNSETIQECETEPANFLLSATRSTASSRKLLLKKTFCWANWKAGTKIAHRRILNSLLGTSHYSLLRKKSDKVTYLQELLETALEEQKKTNDELRQDVKQLKVKVDYCSPARSQSTEEVLTLDRTEFQDDTQSKNEASTGIKTLNRMLSQETKDLEFKQQTEDKHIRCQTGIARLLGFFLVLAVLSVFFVRFDVARRHDAESRSWNLENFADNENGVEFPQITICDNLNKTKENAKKSQLKHIDCSFHEQDLSVEGAAVTESCGQHFVQYVQKYDRNCLVYGNESYLLVAKTGLSTLRLAIDVGTEEGGYKTPWQGALMVVENPYRKDPDFRTYILERNRYYLVEMNRESHFNSQSVYSLVGADYRPKNETLYYRVNTPESGEVSAILRSVYNESQAIAVIDFQFTNLQQSNYVDGKIAGFQTLASDAGSAFGLLGIGYFAFLVLAKIFRLCYFENSGDRRFQCKRTCKCCSSYDATCNEQEHLQKKKSEQEKSLQKNVFTCFGCCSTEVPDDYSE